MANIQGLIFSKFSKMVQNFFEDIYDSKELTKKSLKCPSVILDEKSSKTCVFFGRNWKNKKLFFSKYHIFYLW
jgi:hypothetical protein